MDLPYAMLCFSGVILYRDKDHHSQSSLSRNLRHDEGKLLTTRNTAGRGGNSQSGTHCACFLIFQAVLCSYLFNRTVGENLVDLLIN